MRSGDFSHSTIKNQEINIQEFSVTPCLRGEKTLSSSSKRPGRADRRSFRTVLRMMTRSSFRNCPRQSSIAAARGCCSRMRDRSQFRGFAKLPQSGARIPCRYIRRLAQTPHLCNLVICDFKSPDHPIAKSPDSPCLTFLLNTTSCRAVVSAELTPKRSLAIFCRERIYFRRASGGSSK